MSHLAIFYGTSRGRTVNPAKHLPRVGARSASVCQLFAPYRNNTVSGQAVLAPPNTHRTILPSAQSYTSFSSLSRHRRPAHLIFATMSQALSTSASTSSSNFQSIFNAALKAYEKKTKKDLLAHPLAAQLQACNTPSDILAVLQDKVNELDQSMSADEKLSQWLNPTINVLYSFSATIGAGIGLVSEVKVKLSSSPLSPMSQAFSPASVIFSGIGVLLSVRLRQSPLIPLWR